MNNNKIPGLIEAQSYAASKGTTRCEIWFSNKDKARAAEETLVDSFKAANLSFAPAPESVASFKVTGRSNNGLGAYVEDKYGSAVLVLDVPSTDPEKIRPVIAAIRDRKPAPTPIRRPSPEPRVKTM